MTAWVILGAVWLLAALPAALVVGHAIRLADACSPFESCGDDPASARRLRSIALT